MDEMHEITLSELQSLIHDKKIATLREIFEEYNHVDMAEMLESLSIQDTLFIFKIVKKDITAELFSYLPFEQQEKLITGFTGPEITEMLEYLYTDDIADFLEEMPANIVTHVLHSASTERRAEINALLSYEENTAGSIMTTDYVELSINDTVEEAIKKIKKIGVIAETVNYSYVIDQHRVLLGCVSLRELLFAPNKEMIAEIMNADVICVKTQDDQEEVARTIQKYDITAIPVVNDEDRLVGLITVDDVLDVIERETTEDIQKMGAISPLEDSYLHTSILKMAKSRIVWLLVLMVSATFTGIIMLHFETALAANVALAASIPMLMDTGGNAGSQAATMVIRGIAIGELRLRDFFRILFKESAVALICGITLSVVNFIRIMLITPQYGALNALIVSITIIFAVLIAKIIGGILPLIAVVIKQDPAVMAGPLVTTIVDTITLILYFTLAQAIL